jgi:protein-S-isoprenylcysteine O-methyltransferase Ste14
MMSWIPDFGMGVWDYSQIVLLSYIIIFLGVPYGLAILNKNARQVLKSFEEGYKENTRKWWKFFYLAFILCFLWILICLLYSFHYNSINWFGRISVLDNIPTKILGMVFLGFSLLVSIWLHSSFLSTNISKDEKSRLITTGIYRYTRNPMYLMLVHGVLGTFLLVPNLLTLALWVGTTFACYGLCLEEEKGLLKKYGEEYEHYKKEVGLLFPILKRKNKEST